MKISTKLNGIIALVVVGFVIILGAMVLATFAIGTVHNFEIQILRMAQNSYRLSLETNNILISNEPMQELYSAWRETERDIQQGIEELRQHRALSVLGEDARRGLSSLAQFWERSQVHLRRLEEAVNSVLAMDTIPQERKVGIIPTTEYVLAEPTIPAGVAIELNTAHSALLRINENVMVNLVGFTEQTAGRIAENIEELQRRIFAMVAVGAVVVLLLAVLFALLFTRSLGRRISGIEAVMGRVAERDITVRMADNGRDEIGSLSRHFNDVLATLSLFFASANSAIRQMSELKDTMAASSNESAAALNQISKNIESIKEQFEILDRDIAGSTDAIESIGNEMDGLAARIEQQNSAVSQSSTAIEEMNASIQSVASVATERKERADQLRSVVQDGGEKIGATNEIVRAVTSEIDEILQIIEVINGISSQTNLLSMNAAIESAHAGEAGRGFAVVAEEIRKLSESTSENAKRIGKSLQSITDQIREALAASDQSYASYERISQDVEEFAQAMSEIAASMQELTSASGEVLNSSSEVNRVTGEITESAAVMNQRSNEIRDAMKSVRDISSNVVQGINEIDSGAREILQSMVAVSDATNESKQRMEQLAELIETFKAERLEEPPGTERQPATQQPAAAES